MLSEFFCLAWPSVRLGLCELMANGPEKAWFLKVLLGHTLSSSFYHQWSFSRMTIRVKGGKAE